MVYSDIADRIAEGGAVVNRSEAISFLKLYAIEYIQSVTNDNNINDVEIISEQVKATLEDIKMVSDWEWVLIKECPMSANEIICKEMKEKE